MPSTAWFDALPLLAPLALVLVWSFSRFQPGLRPRLVLRASVVGAGVMLASAAVAVGLVLSRGTVVFAAAGLPLLRLDALSVVMFSLIAVLGTVVLRYSLQYLDGDLRQGNFLGDLALTIAAVGVLVTSATIVQLLAAWVATSLALHHLLLFYPERPGAVLAARKKFVMARLGDVCLAAAAVLLVRAFGTVDLGEMLAAARASAGHAPQGVALAGGLLAVAAALKSAQFPTHGWLVEMMETPTPVSALLHAGILNGGVFLVVRLGEVMLLSPAALHALLVVGGLTALIASTVMVTQPSVKVALAYSSTAHMGFMLMVCGVGVWPMAIMHLVAHSFYKAHAFLSSGSAVEVARTSVGKPSGKGAGLLLGSFALAAVTVAGVGALFGATFSHNAAELGLAATLAIGVTQLFAQAMQPGSSARVLGRTALAAAATAGAFFGLERVANHVLGGAVPLPAAPDPVTVGLMALVVLAFAAGMALQVQLPALAGSPRVAAFWVHLKNGFYANTVFDRLLERRGPANRPPPERPAQLDLAGPTPAAMQAAVERACRTVAPVWPLRHFVAVNPFLGLADLPFQEAAHRVQRTAGARLTMPRAFYAQAFREGRMTEAHLSASLADAAPRPGLPASIEELVALLQRQGTPPPARPLPTVADVTSELTGADHGRLLTDRLSAWAAVYFDEGQASWRSPWRDLGPYAAWRAEAQHDHSPEVLGVKGYRATARGMPAQPDEAAMAALVRLGVPAGMLDLYLERLLATICGWAAYARYRGWDAGLDGQRDGTLAELLSVRLAWEVALLEGVPGAREAWRQAVSEMTAPPAEDRDLAVDLILQEAFERAYREELVGRISSAQGHARQGRPAVQAAFCIDVRSEVLRRALEAVDPEVETIGFAGFFGFAVEVIPLGQTTGGAQCPVLLKPGPVIRETVRGAGEAELARAGAGRRVRRLAAQAWKSFKQGAVSCFAFVGPVGLAYLPKLLSDALGLTRPVPHPARDGLSRAVAAKLGPTLAPAELQGRATGLTPQARLDSAETVLRAMSLSKGPLARLVLLAGHGSTTVNNPHATGLDCGACGGHTGEANARVAAAVLNDAAVRVGLRGRGIEVPPDTVFIPALHDTTTDQVTLYDLQDVPASHQAELERLRHTLAEAGRRTRAERAPRLGLASGPGLDRAILARTRDWAQVRPEWALAGCAAFVAAPRHRTAALDLDGRSFLHSYAWDQDEGFQVLELILTAPVVVASWISLQYYGSTVDNRAYGSGNKVLHNVVGTLGVQEGNGGDLRTGLPWQSVHDGERFVHDPLRLNVVIEAPIEAMNAILTKHTGVRALLDNGWLNLYRLAENGVVSHRYSGALAWERLLPGARAAA